MLFLMDDAVAITAITLMSADSAKMVAIVWGLSAVFVTSSLGRQAFSHDKWKVIKTKH